MTDDTTHALLVEDNPGDARLIREALAEIAQPRLRLEWAENLGKALESLAQQQFSVILLDLSLPDSRGMNTVQRIEQAAPNVPMIVLTGLDDEALAIEAVRSGAQDYLVKSEVTGHLLARAIRYAIERHRMQANLFSTRQMLQLVLDHIPQRIFWKDKDGKYLGVNMAYARAFGLGDPNEILGRTAFDFHTLEHAKAVRRDDVAVMESGIALVDREDAVHLPDGSIRWEMRSKVPLKDVNGDVVGILGLYEDITQFKQGEMAARENELRLRLALSASKQALYEINIATGFITFSPEYAAITGNNHVGESLSISRLFQKIHPDDRDQVENVFHAYLADELPVFRSEGRLEMENGEWKWMLFLGAIVSRDSQRRPTKMLGTVTDISDVKRLADQVQENVARLRNITDTLAEGLLVQDAQGRITFVNPGTTELLGWDEAELIGRNAHEKIHSCRPDGTPLPVDQCPIQTAIQAGKSFIGEAFFRRRDGAMIPVTVSVAPFRKSSHISEAVIAFRCIGEQLRTQQKLKDTLQELSIILNTVQVGIGFIKDRKFVWLNSHMKKMFGYQAREIQNKPTRLIYPDDESYEAVGRLAYPLLAQGKTYEQECQLRRKNGETFWCHMRGSAIDPDDIGKGSIWIILNIDRLIQTEQELQKLNHELAARVSEETRKNIEQERVLIHQSRHAAMGEMIGNIAHQWRQPLNTLGLVIQNIAADYQDDLLDQKSLTEYKNTAINTVQKMSQTIDDFRNFFQPNRLEEIFSLSKPIKEALSLIDASMQNNGIYVTVDCPEDLVAFGLPNEFAQVMLNFLANAKDILVERNVPLKKIEISAREDGKYAVVCVRDNGGGIPADIMDKIFDPYFTSKEGGTGIGLYMTRVIIEQHMHGKISFGNTETGAEFLLSLPREDTRT
jgi:PAS domain S-box-containing protein